MKTRTIDPPLRGSMPCVVHDQGLPCLNVFAWAVCLSICLTGCGRIQSAKAPDPTETDAVKYFDGGKISTDHVQGETAADPALEHNVKGNNLQQFVEPDRSAERKITHADLAGDIAKSKDNSQWHNGERTDGELVGTWTAADGTGHPLIFRADGSFSEDLAGRMTQGVYSISDNGRILTYSRANGVGLRSHFTLQRDTIRGPRGPKPSAIWKRVTK